LEFLKQESRPRESRRLEIHLIQFWPFGLDT